MRRITRGGSFDRREADERGQDHSEPAGRTGASHSGEQYQAHLPPAPVRGCARTAPHLLGADVGIRAPGDFDTLKRGLDREIGQPFAHWTNHTLRHTARSLLSKVTS